jgi:tetratricopeptide (TPR) repeat protein
MTFRQMSPPDRDARRAMCPQSSTPADDRRRARRAWLAAAGASGGPRLGVGLAVVLVLVGAAHRPVFTAGALSFDDGLYITTNPLVQRPGWTSAWRFLTEVTTPSTVRGYYQPLTMISLMLDQALGGRPEFLYPFHRTNWLLHLANTALVILLMHNLFRCGPAALLTGLLFGLHPLTVEPVAWLAERKTLLGTFFALLSLLAYTRYARSQHAVPWIVACVAYALGLLAKPTVTPLPAVMLLLDVWPLGRVREHRPATFWPLVREKTPFFVLGTASGIITLVSQARTASLIPPTAHPPGFVPLVICHNIVFYLVKVFWPVTASAFHPFPAPLSLSHPLVLAGVIGTVVLLSGLVLATRWTVAPLIGWLIFFILVLPTMGIIGFTIVIAADKYAYFPVLGLLLLAAAALSRLWNAYAGRSKLARGLLGLLLLLVASQEWRLTARTYEHWQDTERLTRYMLAHAPQADAVHYSLGVCLLERGRKAEGAAHLQEALRLNPANWMAHTELGALARQAGQLDRAVAHYQTALQIDPQHVPAWNNLASVRLQQGRYEEALSASDEALRLRPEHHTAHLNRGLALLGLHRYEEARAAFEAALRLKPDYTRAWEELGHALLRRGQLDAAAAAYRNALRLDPNSPQARAGLDAVQRGASATMP